MVISAGALAGAGAGKAAAGGGKFIQALTGVAKVIGKGKKKKKGEEEEESAAVKLVGAVGKIVKQREASQRRKIKDAKKGSGIKLSRKSGGGARQGFAG